VYIELFKLWGWEQVALLAEDGQNFPEYNAYLKDRFLSRSIQVTYDRKMPRMANMTDAKKVCTSFKVILMLFRLQMNHQFCHLNLVGCLQINLEIK